MSAGVNLHLVPHSQCCLHWAESSCEPGGGLPSSFPDKLVAKTDAFLSNCLGLAEDYSALAFQILGLEFAITRAHLFSWVTQAKGLLSPDLSFSVYKMDVMMSECPASLGPVCKLRGSKQPLDISLFPSDR